MFGQMKSRVISSFILCYSTKVAADEEISPNKAEIQQYKISIRLEIAMRLNGVSLTYA